MITLRLTKQKTNLPQSYIWISDHFTINGYLQTNWKLHLRPSKFHREVTKLRFFPKYVTKSTRITIGQVQVAPNRRWVNFHYSLNFPTCPLWILLIHLQSTPPPPSLNQHEKSSTDHGDQESSVDDRHLPWQWRRALVFSRVELNQGGSGVRICLQL